VLEISIPFWIDAEDISVDISPDDLHVNVRNELDFHRACWKNRWVFINLYCCPFHEDSVCPSWTSIHELAGILCSRKRCDSRNPQSIAAYGRPPQYFILRELHCLKGSISYGTMSVLASCTSERWSTAATLPQDHHEL